MVSDRIFGQTNAPAREVTDSSEVRPGDIIIAFNSKDELCHVGIASSNVYTTKGLSGATYYAFHTCDGNVNGGYVSWNSSNNYLGTQSTGTYIRAWTRYPE